MIFKRSRSLYRIIWIYDICDVDDRGGGGRGRGGSSSSSGIG